MSENLVPPWVRNLLEIAHRDGVRLEDPRELHEFARAFVAHAAKQASADRIAGVEPWQMLDLYDLFLRPLLERVLPLLGAPPRFALLFLLNNEEGAEYAIDHHVEIRVTLENGRTTSENVVTTIVGMGAARVDPIVQVEPVVPCLGYFLWLCSPPHATHQLLAWHFRSLLAAAPERWLKDLLSLITRTIGSEEIRRRRSHQFSRLRYVERLDLLREALGQDVMEPGVRRMPLHGLMQAGIPFVRLTLARVPLSPSGSFSSLMRFSRSIWSYRTSRARLSRRIFSIRLPSEHPQRRIEAPTAYRTDSRRALPRTR